MKQIISIITFTIYACIGCKNPPKADSAKITAMQEAQHESKGYEYKADIQKSNVQFTGVTPVRGEHGTLSLREGVLTISEKNIAGGHFIIDVTSLKAFDDNGSANEKYQGHLKSPDFFDAEKFPTANFEITKVQPISTKDTTLVMKDATHLVSGNLTIRDVTKGISFPARINFESGNIIADASFNIDRMQWGINYNIDKSKGPKYIKPEINLKLHLEAVK